MLIGLVLTVPASRYFHRRRGPAWGIGFPAVYWAAIILAGWFVSRGTMTWPSLIICLAAAATAVGYAVYLAIRRGDLRLGPAETPGPATRSCPGCGLEIDSRAERCPACGARSDREGPGAG